MAVELDATWATTDRDFGRYSGLALDQPADRRDPRQRLTCWRAVGAIESVAMEQVRRIDLPPRERDDEPVAPPAVAAPQARTQSIDDLLDEIDEVLGDSAESFVKGFVQKGGQ
jgi:ubiquitin-like protein Pup